MSTTTLTPKQETFIQEYVKDMNATQAALRSGYSQKTAHRIGAENMQKPAITSKINEKMRSHLRKLEEEGLDVLRELAILASSDMPDYVRIDEDGNMQIKSFDELKGKSSKAIKSIKQKTVTRQTKGADGEMEPITETTVEFQLWDKVKALELLGKYHKLFTEKLEVKKDELEKMTVDELMDKLKDFDMSKLLSL